MIVWERLTTWNDDDQEQHDDGHDDPDPHLHVLPPHLLADAIGATAEALGGLVQVFGLVLELVDVLAALGDGFEVLFHHVDCVVDLLWKVRVLAEFVWYNSRRLPSMIIEIMAFPHLSCFNQRFGDFDVDGYCGEGARFFVNGLGSFAAHSS